MAGISQLEQLYMAIFHESPTAVTSEMLHTAERVMGIAQDDPFAQVLVMQLRVMDLSARTLEVRSQRESEHLNRAETLAPTLHQAASRVERAARDVASVAERPHVQGFLGGTRQKVDVYNRAFPLWSYLSEAFLPRTGGVEQDERINAARIDLGFVVLFAAIMLMVGAGAISVLA